MILSRFLGTSATLFVNLLRLFGFLLELLSCIDDAVVIRSDCGVD